MPPTRSTTTSKRTPKIVAAQHDSIATKVYLMPNNFAHSSEPTIETIHNYLHLMLGSAEWHSDTLFSFFCHFPPTAYLFRRWPMQLKMPSLLLSALTNMTTERLRPIVLVATTTAMPPITKTTTTMFRSLSAASTHDAQNKRPTIIIYPTGKSAHLGQSQSVQVLLYVRIEAEEMPQSYMFYIVLDDTCSQRRTSGMRTAS